MKHYKPEAELLSATIQVRVPKWWKIALVGVPIAAELREYMKQKYVDKVILKEKKKEEE